MIEVDCDDRQPAQRETQMHTMYSIYLYCCRTLYVYLSTQNRLLFGCSKVVRYIVTDARTTVEATTVDHCWCDESQGRERIDTVK